MTQSAETQPYSFLLHQKRDREQVWRDKVLAVAAHVAVHGKFPRQSVADVKEKRLGVFLKEQRKYANNSQFAHFLTDERRAFLDERIPGWLHDSEQKWRDRVLGVAAYVTQHGKFPSHGLVEIEVKRLGSFLSTQRMQANGNESAHLLTPERRAFLDEHLPGWLPPRRKQ